MVLSFAQRIGCPLVVILGAISADAVVEAGFVAVPRGGSAAAGSSESLMRQAALSDYTSDAISLFDNMRAPAALLAGGLVPLGILGAEAVKEGDKPLVKGLKKASILLAVASLLNEIFAVTQASIAINKLVEVPSPPTSSVAELISKKQRYELLWLGTNFHFLAGMMGFGLLVGIKAYLMFGNPIGNLAIGLTASFFLGALATINRGVAFGTGDGDGRFASNFFGLTLRYFGLMAKESTTGVCSMAYVIISLATAVQAVRVLFFGSEIGVQS